MDKKYELTNDVIEVDSRTLHRIRALRSFGYVTEGDLGGYIEAECNLSHNGSARVCGNADYAVVQGFGTCFRPTTFFRCNDGKVRVKCGCFYGTIDEFREQVNNTRSGKVAKEYLMIADLMEYHFEEEENDRQ